METLSRVHAKNLVKWAGNKPEVLVLSADLTSSTEIDLFREAYPSRFISAGIAEQNMLSVAAGLAREGFVPFIHTFAVFIYRRAFDQMAMSIAYSNLPVKMFGFLPGITTPGGATHQATDDIAVVRALPNMTIFEAGDATEVESLLDPVMETNGPVYIRMLRGDVPRLFDKNEPLKKGINRVLSRGTDFTVISSGLCTEEAIKAVKALKAKGLSITHFHVSTLKPFNSKDILDSIASSKYGAITMENHTVLGGLGSIVADAMAGAGIGKKLYKLGLQDKFGHGASKGYLMREYGFDAMALVLKAEEIAGAKFGITENELKSVKIEVMHGDIKAEDL
ncbi:MAG: transketolase C-terminal domain-containing protein [Candidatus Goldiibacteriota bacterium]